MPDQPITLDTVFHALADPTRRAVIQHLSNGAATVTELSEPFDMAWQSFVQHSRVLEDCGLISSKKMGRVRMCQIAPERLDGAQDWISELHRAWANRLDEYLEKQPKKNKDEQR